MPRVALTTHAGVPRLTEDDGLLLEELRRRGVEARPVLWDDAAVRWETYDRVVIRSCWDYHRRLPEFFAWLERLEGQGVPLWNPAPLVRWNARKTYLRELEGAGARIVPTAWLARGASSDLAELLAERGWVEAVIKPAVSASAFRTWRVSARQAAGAEVRRVFGDLLAEGDVLVQRFLPEIERSGEWSLVFLGGGFSHAVLKRPAEGDFRVQMEFGGRVAPESPPASVVSQAREVAALIPGPWAYARIDGVAAGEAFTLMEVELIEPYLFLSEHARAAARLADAILSEDPLGRSGGAG
jgi:glutathione synthase/RimK-type ligase-like ATP-grasp enzyme